MPDAGEGTSVSTLSVETSSSGSSAATSSPSCLSQRVTVPSVTLSPRRGMVTETGMLSGSSSLVQGRTVKAGCERGGAQSCTCSGLPASSRCASPIASDWVGCGWISWATSLGSASQL